MSLMQLIKDYDAQVQRDFEDLNREIAELMDQNQKLLDQVVQGVATSDRMKLDLILNGCLVHPNEERVTIDRKLFLRVTDTLRGCLSYLPLTGRAEVRQLIDQLDQLDKAGDNT